METVWKSWSGKFSLVWKWLYFRMELGKYLLNVISFFNVRCLWQDTHFVKQVLLVRGTSPKTPDNCFWKSQQEICVLR